MKIFISWSGLLSKRVAKIVKQWLNKTVFDDEELVIFISEDDIEIGSDWLKIIKNELIESDLAIAILTKDNVNKPWLNFECGSLAFGKDDRNVVPFLVNIENADIKSPLKHFQTTSLNKDQIHKLILDIKKIGNFKSLTEKHLEKLVDDFYKQLSDDINSSLKEFADNYKDEEFIIFPKSVRYLKKGKVFVGIPMASATPDEYPKYRDQALSIKEVLINHAGVSEVYCPCEHIMDVGSFEGIEKSINDDFQILKESEHYIFVYPCKIASSILVEMGYAIALSKHTTIFARNRKDLPFMLEQADVAISNIKIYDYNDIDDIKKIIKSNGPAFLERRR
jgi:hypothetical protein